MTLVVHISADYPDRVDAAKTRAIQRLVAATDGQLQHRVYSLNRSGGFRAWLVPGACAVADDDGELAALRYLAPGKGIGLGVAMDRVAAFIARDLQARGIRPDLIHGHKLSVEGLAAHRLAELLGVPFALTLQGNSDRKIVGARPDLRGRWRRCWQDAALVFPFAPWIADWCSQSLGPRDGPIIALPCIPATETLLAPTANAQRIVTAFNFNDWRNKNIAVLARAVAAVARDHPQVELHVAGSGDPSNIANVQAAIGAAGISERSHLHGWLGPDQLQALMNEAAVFAMPSRRETFGMVFIEALFAGVPIIYPQGIAVDGYFPGRCFATPVPAGNCEALAAALGAHLRDCSVRKQELAAWQMSAEVGLFRGRAIASRYVEAVRDVVRG